MPEQRLVDPEIKAIDDELSRRNLPRAALGRVIGLDSKQLNRLFKGERKLQHHEALAAKEWLWPGSGGSRQAGAAVVPLPGMIPLYSWSRNGGGRKLKLAIENLRAYVPTHPNQANVIDPFALEVPDLVMSPRYEPGEIVYVAPYRYPPRGQDAVVMTADDDAYLCRYVGRDDEFLSLEQLHPAKRFTVKLAEASVHAIVGRG